MICRAKTVWCEYQFEKMLQARRHSWAKITPEMQKTLSVNCLLCGVFVLLKNTNAFVLCTACPVAHHLESIPFCHVPFVFSPSVDEKCNMCNVSVWFVCVLCREWHSGRGSCRFYSGDDNASRNSSFIHSSSATKQTFWRRQGNQWKPSVTLAVVHTGHTTLAEWNSPWAGSNFCPRFDLDKDGWRNAAVGSLTCNSYLIKINVTFEGWSKWKQLFRCLPLCVQLRR